MSTALAPLSPVRKRMAINSAWLRAFGAVGRQPFARALAGRLVLDPQAVHGVDHIAGNT